MYWITVIFSGWYVSKQEPYSEEGSNMGLTVMLDAHSNILSPSSIYTDFEGQSFQCIFN